MLAHSPSIVRDGLILCLDGANTKSFKGEVTTNLIPNPTVNAYPTTGNGWGSYNTNQYNGGQYFSIGSIASVSSNIITTSTNHPLRTYDVVTPQTTGGGVTAGTYYFVKKLSNTTFTLHEYNGSQDGSQGYISSSTGTHKVYDSIATDTRISVNSTSFPTMWWGPPHTSNSGLVKELRYGEFNAIPNLPANDCIRLHYIRTDDVKDGMSYGVDCSVTAGSPVTVSFYTRSANANAVGKVVQYYIYNYTGGSAQGYAWNFTLGALGVWQRQTFTYTPAYATMISYWFPQSGGVYSWDWSCMQVEQKSYVTSFVAGTRGSTVATGGGWADLSGNSNHGTLVNGVAENSSNLGCLSFDGSNQYVTTSNTTISGSQTFSVWMSVGTTSPNSPAGVLTQHNYASTANFGINHVSGNKLASSIGYTDGTREYSSKITSFSPTVNVIFNAVLLYNSSENKIYWYINGALDSSYTLSATPKSTNYPIGLGRWDAGYNNYYFNGKIYYGLIYNKALTSLEVQQNFNALRGRFGI